MAEENKSLTSRLRSGEKVLCDECKKGYLIPYNTTPDKAHSFICSNQNCNRHINITYAIPEMDEFLYGDLK